MKTRQLSASMALVMCVSASLMVEPMGTAFTYHGQLQQSGSPVNARCDFQFGLWDAGTDGVLIGETQTVSNVAVSNGLFTVQLDFGPGAFNGDTRWLELSVRNPAGSGEFTMLTPRQEITATPYALQAATSASAKSVPATGIMGQLVDSQVSTNVALLNGSPTFAGAVTAASFSGGGNGLTNLSLASLGLGDAITLAPMFSLASSPRVGSHPYSATSADVNGDGWADLISADYRDHTLTVLTNNGSGGFVLASTAGVGSGPHSVTSADVNGDGHPDLISANFDSHTITVLTNNGSGGFAFAPCAVPGYSRELISVTTADVNRDGWADLIVLDYVNDFLMVLTNNGSGGFVYSTWADCGFHPTSVVAADVNGDGWADLISAIWSENRLTVLTNNGSGGFALATKPTVGVAPASVTAADVNGDGWADLISANYNDNTLTVLTNNGSAGFGLSASPQVGSNPYSVTSADLNRDGWPDLICANSASDTLTVLMNNGSGGFVLAATPTVGDAPVSVVAVDVNGDSYPDLVSANQGDDTLSVLFRVAPVVINADITGGFVGDGLGITNIQGQNIVGPIPETSIPDEITHQLVLTNEDNVIVGTVTGEIAGSGAGLTNVQTTNLVGTIPDELLSTNVALLNAGQTFTGTNAFTNPANIFVGHFSGTMDGAQVTNVPMTHLTGVLGDTQFDGTYTRRLDFSNPSNNYSGSGTNLTSLNASSLVVGTIADARLSTNVAFLDRDQTFSGANNFSNQANVFTGTFVGNAAGLTNLSASNLSGSIPDAQLSANVVRLNSSPTFSGTVTATALVGNGVGLTNLDAANLMTGILPGGRLAGGYSNQINFSHSMNSFVGTFIGDGSGLTNLAGAGSSDCWLLTGNAGVTPGTEFLGTTDNQPLEIRVNSRRALRIEPTGGDAPNWIAGSSGNVVGVGVQGATIAGGGDSDPSPAMPHHRIAGDYSTIGGGRLNTVETMAHDATIGGGHGNLVQVEAESATIGGGVGNVANGARATVPGGMDNTAGGVQSFAAGSHAKALHPGSFVWGDSQADAVQSSASNQVTFRCSGGVRFISGSDGPRQQVSWTPDSGSWDYSSDRNLKEGIQSVDTREVFEKVACLPIFEWRFVGYKTRHIGAMAQDFNALFPLNENQTTLNDTDLHGVSLAAIQGLNQKLSEELRRRDAEIADLKSRLERLEQMLPHTFNGGAR